MFKFKYGSNFKKIYWIKSRSWIYPLYKFKSNVVLISIWVFIWLYTSTWNSDVNAHFWKVIKEQDRLHFKSNISKWFNKRVRCRLLRFSLLTQNKITKNELYLSSVPVSLFDPKLRIIIIGSLLHGPYINDYDVWFEMFVLCRFHDVSDIEALWRRLWLSGTHIHGSVEVSGERVYKSNKRLTKSCERTETITCKSYKWFKSSKRFSKLHKQDTWFYKRNRNLKLLQTKY